MPTGHLGNTLAKAAKYCNGIGNRSGTPATEGLQAVTRTRDPHRGQGAGPVCGPVAVGARGRWHRVHLFSSLGVRLAANLGLTSGSSSGVWSVVLQLGRAHVELETGISVGFRLSFLVFMSLRTLRAPAAKAV